MTRTIHAVAGCIRRDQHWHHSRAGSMASTPDTAIKVINLDRSVDRRQAFTQMAHGTELDWSFFRAHTGITKPLRYDDRDATRRCGRPLSPSEIGCYTSHFKMWEWLAGSDYDQAIIFEDDVIVDWSAITKIVVNNLEEYGINLLKLHISYPFHWKIVKYKCFSPNFHLIRPVGTALGAIGYILTKTAAQTLVSNYAVIAAPVDWVLARYWEHRITGYCIFPFPVLERQGPSTIGDERYIVPRPALFDRIARIGWRIRDRARRAYVERCLIKKYPLGPTKYSDPPFFRA
jgi:glycosyl transferase, family 25